MVLVNMEKGGEMKGKMPLGMGSHDVASGSVQSQDHESRSNALGVQGSPSLMLNEVQNHVGDSGEPLESMNLDELLMTLWPAENSQGMGEVDYGSSSQHSQGALGTSLQQQPNVVQQSRDLSDKSSLEVGQDIERRLISCNIDSKSEQRQAPLMTLDELMFMAGVLPKTSPAKTDSGSVLGVDPISLPQKQAPWENDQIQSNHPSQPCMQHQQQNTVPLLMPWGPVQPVTPSNENSMVGLAYPDTQIMMSAAPFPKALLDMIPGRRKRVASGDVVEQFVDAKQKRKIKNREAAVQSRMKKEAEVLEMKNTIARLKEENGRLKKLKEFVESQSSLPAPEQKYQHRRTSSAFF